MGRYTSSYSITWIQREQNGSLLFFKNTFFKNIKWGTHPLKDNCISNSWDLHKVLMACCGAVTAFSRPLNTFLLRFFLATVFKKVTKWTNGLHHKDCTKHLKITTNCILKKRKENHSVFIDNFYSKVFVASEQSYQMSY